MRRVLISIGLVAGLGLAACEKPVEEAAPVKPKSMARPDQMYAGEEHLQSIVSGTVERGHGEGVVAMKATAMAPTTGYTRPYFLPRIYPATPPDGIYEVDLVAAKPTTPGQPTPTELKLDGAWNKYKDDRVKGVKFMTKTNELVVMLPPKAP